MLYWRVGYWELWPALQGVTTRRVIGGVIDNCLQGMLYWLPSKSAAPPKGGPLTMKIEIEN